jgi:hypothetical protein
VAGLGAAFVAEHNIFGSKAKPVACTGVGVTVFFQPSAVAADFQPVLSRVSRLPGVLEIGFASQEQSHREDQLKLGNTGVSLALSDVPPSYRLIMENLGDARMVRPTVGRLPGVFGVVLGTDINRPVETGGLDPAAGIRKGQLYMGTLVVTHCGGNQGV